MDAARTINRVAREAVSAARAGEKVAIFGDTVDESSEFARTAFEALTGADRADVRRARGNETIRFPHGGTVYFRSLRQSGRGLAVDRAYVPAAIKDEHAVAVAPSLATSRNPQMIGYFRMSAT